MKKILIFILLVGGTGYGLLNFHFILFDKSLKVLKKSEVRYQNTFVDARGAKKMELITKPDLIAAGITDVVSQLEAGSK